MRPRRRAGGARRATGSTWVTPSRCHLAAHGGASAPSASPATQLQNRHRHSPQGVHLRPASMSQGRLRRRLNTALTDDVAGRCHTCGRVTSNRSHARLAEVWRSADVSKKSRGPPHALRGRPHNSTQRSMLAHVASLAPPLRGHRPCCRRARCQQRAAAFPPSPVSASAASASDPGAYWGLTLLPRSAALRVFVSSSLLYTVLTVHTSGVRRGGHATGRGLHAPCAGAGSHRQGADRSQPDGAAPLRVRCPQEAPACLFPGGDGWASDVYMPRRTCHA